MLPGMACQTVGISGRSANINNNVFQEGEEADLGLPLQLEWQCGDVCPSEPLLCTGRIGTEQVSQPQH